MCLNFGENYNGQNINLKIYFTGENDKGENDREYYGIFFISLIIASIIIYFII